MLSREAAAAMWPVAGPMDACLEDRRLHWLPRPVARHRLRRRFAADRCRGGLPTVG
jgi:hypothetical protein